MGVRVCNQPQQVLSVSVLPHRARDGGNLSLIDIAHDERDFLGTGHHEALTILNCLYEI